MDTDPNILSSSHIVPQKRLLETESNVPDEYSSKRAKATSADSKSSSKPTVHPFFQSRQKKLPTISPADRQKANNTETPKDSEVTKSAVLSEVVGMSEGGQSLLLKSDRELRRLCAAGMYEPSAKRFLNFQEKCQEFDPEATFDPFNHPQEVKHSWCQKWIPMKAPGNVSHFREHVEKAKCKKAPVPDAQV